MTSRDTFTGARIYVRAIVVVSDGRAGGEGKMATYLCDDGNAEIEIGADSAREAAEQYVADGDWGDDTVTQWVTVSVQEVDDDGEEVGERDSYDIAIEPTAPDCDEAEHDWRSPVELVGGLTENPGVQGHGGGVIIDEACVVCGCRRRTDTWANGPGGQQGYEEVSYQEGAYSISEHLRDLVVGYLDQTDHEQVTEDTATFVVEGPWGWWGSVVAEDGDHQNIDVAWTRDESEARRTSAADAERLGEYRGQS